MPNIVTVGANPNSQIVSQFLDQFNANRRSDQQDSLGRDQLAQAAKFHQDDFSIQSGQLADLQARTAQARQIYNDSQMNDRVKEIKAQIGIQHDIINTPGMDPMRKAAAEATAKQLITNAQSDPKLKPYFDLDTVESALKSLTAEQQAKLGGDQTVASMTSRAAQGGTAPNDVAAALKTGPTQAYPTPQMFGQQQQTDLDARRAAGTPTPDPSSPMPKPSSNFTSNFEARSGEAMPTSAQDQAAQTTITTEGMRQTGETKRTGMTNATQVKVAEMNAARTPMGGVNPDDAKAIAGEIVAGRQPPTVHARIEGPVRAALARDGYDLTKATQDWTSTQKYLSTLNGPGQVRLRQAVDFAYESIPLVNDLAKQWQGGGFPLLNSAKLFGAKQGAFGPQAQQIAVKLDQQIVEMQAELAVVYRGGNSPTDEAMKQAAHVLQANWSLPTLQSALGLLQQNLLIRRNSIVSAGAATNDGNTYAPNVSIAAPGGTPASGNPLGLTPPGAH